MKLIKSIVRPNKVDDVKDALEKLNISGMTVTEVRGHGKQKGPYGHLPRQGIQRQPAAEDGGRGGRRRLGSSTTRSRRSSQAARTGEIGDGRVFVLPVEQTYRIRTGERDSL